MLVDFCSNKFFNKQFKSLQDKSAYSQKSWNPSHIHKNAMKCIETQF